MQLTLPLSNGPESTASSIAPGRRVFAARDLKLSHCEWVGFDMDYTLAIYHQQAMDQLSIEATAAKLVAHGYPALITEIDYPLDFPIRGLLVDKNLGNVVKLNRFKIARRGYHGLRQLDHEELRTLYYERKIRHKSARYHWIDTLYALSEACMYAAIIEALDRRGDKVDYRQLFSDIRLCIDEAHRDGAILDPVMRDPGKFVERDPGLAATLHKLRSSGKKLFLLTNSRWTYTKVLMSYLLDDAMADYPSFGHYFDALVVAARKPSFFESEAPLMELCGEQLIEAELPLDRGRIYCGGNLRALQQALGVSGEQVLYVGDHIYGDMLRSKKSSAWRTAMVIPELEAEVAAHEQCHEDLARDAEIYHQRYGLEDRLRFYLRRLKAIGRNGDHQVQRARRSKAKMMVASIRKQLRALDGESRRLWERMDARFHPYWGPLLKEEGELSLFGHQVSEYACVYTSRVSNLLAYSPHYYFRSPHNLMPHEL